MPESTPVVRPVPMESASFTAGTRLQAAGLREAITLFERAADTVPLPTPPQPIVVADYGASTGHNALLPIRAAIAVLRRRTRPEHSILVTHTDVPENDFTALFQTLSDDPDSYLRADPAAFTSAIGRSFYTQILPSNSVNLAWSSWAIQWLGRTPAPVPDHVQVAYTRNSDVRTAYAKQAAYDWHEFIAFRGRELCPGGRLVVLTAAVDEHGEVGYRPLMSAIMDSLAELQGHNMITEDELAAMTIPMVARRAADFLVPFAPSGKFEQLAVEHLEVFDAEDRYWARYQKDKDATAFGAQWAAFCRTSLFPALVSALPGGSNRTAPLLDRLESCVAERMAAAPEQSQLPLAYVVLVKRPKP